MFMLHPLLQLRVHQVGIVSAHAFVTPVRVGYKNVFRINNKCQHMIIHLSTAFDES